MLQGLLSPISIVIIIALLISVFFWLQTFFILYHLMRFGIGTRPKQAALICLIGSISIFFLFIVGFVFLSLNVPSFINAIMQHSQ